ncbi:MAG: hypothetical protein WC222_04190 [Parachlamydiales bacterium]|jgi:hypothetical protein
MLIEDASSILQQINSRFNPENSVEWVINDMFAPSLWGSSLVERTSLHGRISLWAYSYVFSTPAAEKIKDLVITAFSHLQQRDPACDGISFHLRKALFLLSQPASIAAPQPILNTQNIELHRDFLCSQSLFIAQRHTNSPINEDTVKDWLNLSTSPSSSVWDLLAEYSPTSRPFIDKIKSALNQRADFKQQIITQAHDDNSDNVTSLGKLAQSITSRIHDLKPGEKWLFCSGGRQSGTSFELLRALNHLPPALAVNLPAEWSDIQKTVSEISQPEDFVRNLIHNQLTEFGKELPLLAESLKEPGISLLFPNEAHRFPPEITDELPTIYSEGLNALAKNGLIQACLLILPSGTAKDMIEWVQANITDLSSPEKMPKKLKEIEDKLCTVLLPFLNQSVDILDHSTQGLVQSIQKIIPPYLLEAIGLEHILGQGTIWLEFEGSENSSVSLKIYGVGNALIYHPSEHSTENIIWPLCYENIPLSKLNQEFLFAVVSHTFEPLINPKKISSPKDFYNGVLQALELPPTSIAGMSIPSTTSLADLWEFALAMIKPSTTPFLQKYTIVKEIFLGYSHSIKDADGKIRPSEMTLSYLERLVLSMQELAEKNKDLITAQELLQLQNTQQWILFEKQQLKKALDNSAIKKSLLPPDLLIKVKSHLKKWNITPEKWQEAKTLIVKVFGTDTEQLLSIVEKDFFDENFEELPTKNEGKGWLQDSLQRLYSNLAYNTYRAAIGISNQHATEYRFFQYTKAVHYFISSYLPSPVREWYCSAIDYLESFFKRAAFGLVIWILSKAIGEEGLKSIEETRLLLQTHVKQLTAYIDPRPKLTLDLTPDLLVPAVLKSTPVQTIHSYSPLEDISVYSKFKTVFIEEPPTPFPLNAESVHPYFIAVIKKLKNINLRSKKSESPGSINATFYALNTLFDWPIPTLHQKCIWDDVENPEELMEYISEVTSYINNFDDTTLNGYFSKSNFSTIANYSSLAILDKLARRCDPLLGDTPIYALPLLNIYKSQKALISADQVARFKNLVAYFLPKIDTKTLKKGRFTQNPQVKYYQENSLFYFTSGAFPKRRTVVDSIEGQYYKKLMNGRPASSLFPSCPSKRFTPQNEVEALLLLENESHILNEEYSPIPRTFALLKRQVWIANSQESYGNLPRITTYHKPILPWNSPESSRANIDFSLCDNDRFLPYANNKSNPGTLEDTLEIGHTQHSVMESSFAHINTMDYSLVDIKQKDSFLRSLELLQLHFDYYERLPSHAYEFFEIFLKCPGLDYSFLTYDSAQRALQIIGDSIQRLIKIKSKWVFEWILLGLRLQNLEPIFKFDHALTFPPFKDILYNMVNSYPRKYRKAWILLAFSLPDNPDELSEDEQREGARSLLLTHFRKNSSRTHADICIKMVRWNTVITAFLNKPAFANSIGQEIVTLFHPEAPEKPQKFSYSSYTYNNGQPVRIIKSKNFFIVLPCGSIYHFGADLKPEALFTETIARNHPRQNFTITDTGQLLSEQGDCIFEKSPDILGYTKKVLIEGKWYLSCFNYVPSPGLEGLMGSFPTEVFLEDAPHSHKVLRIDKDRQVVIDAQKNDSQTILNIHLHGQNLIPVDPHHFSHLIQPILRFTSLNTIECWCDAETKALKYIYLLDYKLLVTVEVHGRRAKGFIILEGTKYFLSDTYFEGQKGLSLFLGLENVHGRRYVIVVDSGQIVSSVLNRLKDYLQLREEVFEFFKWINRSSSTSKFLLFELDESEHLNSDNPFSLAYALNLYLLQGNLKQAQVLCDKLIHLSRQGPLPLSILTELSALLTIPGSIEGYGSIRMKLLAALGMNQHLYCQKSIPKNDYTGPFTALFSILSLKDLSDLQLKQNSMNLSDMEEWALYSFIINSLNYYLHKGGISTEFNSELSSLPPETILYVLNLSPKLSERIIALNKKYSIEESSNQKYIRFVADVYNRSFPIPKQKLDSIHHPSSMDNLWSKYISEILTNAHLKTDIYKDLFTDILKHPPQADLTQAGFRKNLIPSFCAYYEIAQKRTKNDYPKLKKLLQLNKSGWSDASRLLIHILVIITNFPINQSPVENLQQWLNKKPGGVGEKNYEYRLNGFKKFLDSILKSQYTDNQLLFITKEILFPLLSFQLEKAGVNPLVIVNPRTLSLNIAQLTGKIALSLYNRKEIDPAEYNPPQRYWAPPSSLNSVDAYDQEVDAFLKTIYGIAFEEVPFNDPQETIFTLFSTPRNASDAEKIKLKHINDSLIKYYTRQNRIPSQNKFKGSEQLWEAFTFAFAFNHDMEREFSAHKAALEKVLNPPEMPFLPHTSLKELRQAILDEDLSTIRIAKYLSVDDMEKLVLGMVQCDAMESRLHQIHKLMQYMDGALAALADGKGQKFGEQLELLGNELKVVRAYTFTSIPFRLSFLYLTYERSTQRILWPKQAKAFTRQLTLPGKHLLSELMPSLGKTEVALGLQKAYIADRRHVPVTSAPSQLAPTNFKLVSKQCNDIYGLQDTILTIHRSQNRTSADFQGLYIAYANALENRGSISMCKEGSQSLELESIIRGYMMITHSFWKSEEEMKCLESLKQTLSFKKIYCVLLGDEWHEDGKQNKELIYPVGNKKHLEPDIEKVILMTIQSFIEYPGVQELLMKDELKTITPQQYRKIVTVIADKLSYSWQYNIKTPTDRADFINYVIDERSAIPESIENNPFWNEISTIRGILSVIIPSVRQQSINVNFGVVTAAHVKDKDKADEKKLPLNTCPFVGNNAPLLGHTVQLPYEDYVKSFFSYMFNGIGKENIHTTLDFLLTHATNASKQQQKPIENTSAHKFFNLICKETPLKKISEYSADEILNIEKAFQHSPEACHLFHLHFVSKDIYYWERYARSNPTNYVDMFHSSKVQTGTPYNHDVYFADIQLLFDKGTLGEIIHLISNRCQLTANGILPKASPEKLLDEILLRFFTPEKNSSLLVDGAPLFKGILNIDVAHKMAQFCLDHHLEKEAIVFYHKNDLVAMDINTRTLLPFADCKLSPEQHITYLDDPHGFGSNIPQSGNAVNTVGEEPFFKVVQESFRLREIKKIISLILEGNYAAFAAAFSEVKSQEIFYVMLEETRDKIHPAGPIPTVKELFAYSRTLESEDSKPDNYEAYLQKLHNVVRREILNRMYFAPDIKTFLEVLKTFAEFLVPQTVIDPIRLFGWMQKDILATDAIEITKKNMISIIDKTPWFSTAEIVEVRSKLDSIPLPPIPETVRVLTYGKKVDTFVNDQLNKELYVNQQNDVETSKQLQQERSNQVQTTKPYSSSFKEKKWKLTYNPRSLEWRNTSSDNRAVALIKEGLQRLTKKNTQLNNMELNSFAFICSQAPTNTVQRIAPYFDKRLWASENFIPLNKLIIGKTVPFRFRHCNVFEVLLHIQINEEGLQVASAGCLSQKDANRWRKILTQPPKENDQYKVILYDVFSRSKAAGDDVDMDALRSNADFNILEAQIRFFNGNLNYPQELQKPLEDWITKHPALELAIAIKHIALRIPRHPYTGSDMEQLFAKILNIPIAELI